MYQYPSFNLCPNCIHADLKTTVKSISNASKLYKKEKLIIKYEYILSRTKVGAASHFCSRCEAVKGVRAGVLGQVFFFKLALVIGSW